MAITGPPIEAELRNRALDAVYGAVLQPEHHTAIIKAWATCWMKVLFVAARFFPDLLLLPFRYCASDFWSGPEGARRAIEASG
ncbi:MAG: hypothetical protein AAFQ66_21310 [Pseudomonadota bacterium]